MTVAKVGRFEVMRDGTLPKFTSIGSYPLFYVTMESECLCADCANTRTQDSIDAADANWEDPSLYCDECGERIESAYAEDSVTEGGE